MEIEYLMLTIQLFLSLILVWFIFFDKRCRLCKEEKCEHSEDDTDYDFYKCAEERLKSVKEDPAKRKLSIETQEKVLRVASTILFMHGGVAGDRTCQDWSGEKEESPEAVFTEQELDDIYFNYELYNSGGEDYEPGEHGFHDEMSASWAIARAIEDMLYEQW